MKTYMYAYKNGSKSAKLLSEALGIKRLKHEGKPIEVGLLINWGASSIKRAVTAYRVINEPEAIRLAANKLKTFRKLAENGDINIPEFTENPYTAVEWFDAGQTVVARHTLTGHSGEGISIANAGKEIPEGFIDAPLYTKYIRKKQEYRVHVCNGEAFFIQRKARSKDVADADVNWQIRNHANGFIFAHKDLGDLPFELEEQAVLAVDQLGLDFGAVDIVFDLDKKRPTVLEVNTACGIEGTTLEKYVEQFNNLIEGEW